MVIYNENISSNDKEKNAKIKLQKSFNYLELFGSMFTQILITFSSSLFHLFFVKFSKTRKGKENKFLGLLMIIMQQA